MSGPDREPDSNPPDGRASEPAVPEGTGGLSGGPEGTGVPLGYGPPPGPPAMRPAPQVRTSWTVSAPPGTPYHRLGRTPLHRWWRPVLGTGLVVGGALVTTMLTIFVGILIAYAGGISVFPGGRLFGEPLLELGVTLAGLALVLPVVFFTVWFVGRRPPGTVSSVAGRLRWRWMLLCSAVAVVAVVLAQLAVLLTLTLSGGRSETVFGWVGWERFLPALIVTLLLVPFQAAAEEYAIRGWLLQAFGSFFRNPWPGILLGSVAFTYLHAYTDWGIVDVFTFGVVAAWLTVRTGGLEAAIALHVVNNVVAFGVTAAAGQLESALKQGAVPWQSIVGTVVQMAIFTICVVVLARRKGVRTTS
ncbi:CPBP family intramembrane glutamic endopeptidase [Rhizohabitans arisaemae]|uniref:CPBP family intramembrane glutamic endopeptidase n=1 Tax=Rhizohabitans arisaemae TaxID=2720610 RepID=UPI0024B0951D|nr:type II CAAX endopeptidase family protein [Rhizohabitans arisaemae]